MISKKERMVWIFIILIAVVSTFLITSKSIVIPRNNIGNLSSTVTPTGIEQEADQWFTSRYSPMPRRDFYTQRINIDNYLLIYQSDIERKKPWISYPEQIVLRSFYPPPEIEGYVPNKVSIYFYNSSIESILITEIYGSGLGARESRFDFIEVDKIWKIVWVGERSIDIFQ
jgi:hypothetical protein